MGIRGSGTRRAVQIKGAEDRKDSTAPGKGGRISKGQPWAERERGVSRSCTNERLPRGHGEGGAGGGVHTSAKRLPLHRRTLPRQPRRQRHLPPLPSWRTVPFRTKEACRWRPRSADRQRVLPGRRHLCCCCSRCCCSSSAVMRPFLKS